MITLYQTEWCPYSHRVRQALTELGLTYTAVNVAADPGGRADVIAVSGQASTPVLQDGDKIFRDSDEILEYLRGTYPEPPDAGAHAAQGTWRLTSSLSLSPRAAAARLRELLEGRGLRILAELRGPEVDEHLPEEYLLLEVGVPVALAKTLEIDPLAVAQTLLPVAVVPADGGGCTVVGVDPVGQVWLLGEPPLLKVQAAVKKRLREVFREL